LKQERKKHRKGDKMAVVEVKATASYDRKQKIFTALHIAKQCPLVFLKFRLVKG
jgi:hypothetical protein